MPTYNVHDRIVLTRAISHALGIVNAGQTGEVIDVDDNGDLMVLLDRDHPDLRHLNNMLPVRSALTGTLRLSRWIPDPLRKMFRKTPISAVLIGCALLPLTGVHYEHRASANTPLLPNLPAVTSSTCALPIKPTKTVILPVELHAI